MGESEFNPNTDRSVQCAGAVLAMSMKSPPLEESLQISPGVSLCDVLSAECLYPGFSRL